MRATTLLTSIAALAIATLLATPAAAEWWDWAAPRVDRDPGAAHEVRDRDREDVIPRPDDDRAGDDRDRDDRGAPGRRGGPPGTRPDGHHGGPPGGHHGQGHGKSHGATRGGPHAGPHGDPADAAFCRSGEGHPVFGVSWCHGNRTGPAFCRTGEGHPKFGMAWCFEKGFVSDRAGWRTWDPGDVIFDRRPERRVDDGSFGERVLEEVLGDVILRRLLAERSELGLDQDLMARWYVPDDPEPARVLQVRAGELPLAELSDLDGDGRVEVALLLEP